MASRTDAGFGNKLLNTNRHITQCLLAVILLSLLSACSNEPADQSAIETQPAEPHYLGAESCENCHAEQFDLWRDSHHDLAMQVATKETALGDFSDASFTHSGITSTFFVKNDTLWVSTDGADGKLADFPVLYTFGVEPLQQYLVELPDKKIQALSIAWDTRDSEQGGQRWFHLYAEEKIDYTDVLHWTQPSQNWETMCADCHSTALISDYDIDTDSFATSWEEMNVACEACHGPASAHVVWAKSGASDANTGLSPSLHDRRGVNWLSDPTSGNSQRSVPPNKRAEIQACAGCHSRRMRLTDDTPPDHQFLDGFTPAAIQPPLYHPDGQIRDEVYVYGSFLQSKMFQAGVTCSDCHEPHSLDLRAPGAQVCLQCHLDDRYATPEHQLHQAETAAVDCIDCHMPATTYMQVDERNDHSFSIPRPDLAASIDTPSACARCHSEGEQWAAAKLAAAGRQLQATAHWSETLAATERTDMETLRNLLQLAEDETVPPIIRGTAAGRLSLDDTPQARQVISLLAQESDPLIRRGAAQALQNSHPQLAADSAVKLLDDPVRAVRIEAATALAGVDPVFLAPGTQKKLRAALEEYIAVQLVSSERAESHINVATVYRQLNQLEEAENSLQLAIKLNPYFVPAYVNLADLYRVWEREPLAEATLRQGLEALPDQPALHHSLGLSLIRQGNQAGALAELRAAAESENGVARYALVYSVALNEFGQQEAAREYLRAAVSRFDNDPQLLGLLAELEGS